MLVVYYVGRWGGSGQRRGTMTRIYYIFFSIKKKENEVKKIQGLPKCYKASWF